MVISGEPNVPVLDDRTQLPELGRPTLFLQVLDALGIEIVAKRVVDLGAGYGSISLALAQAGATVTAVDAAPDRIDAINQRADDDGIVLEARTANLLRRLEEITDQDLALMVGVVEYAGLWHSGCDVESLQLEVLRTAYETLRPGGELVLCTKNRLWPVFVVRDVHTNLPLVNVLPRPLAERLSRVMCGESYRRYIHTPRVWVSMLKRAGFSHAEVFYPYFSYQYPVAVTNRPSLADISRLPKPSPRPRIAAETHGRGWRIKVTVMAAAHRVGIPLSQSLIIKAVK